MTRQRRPLAAVYAEDGTVGAWLIAESPLEARAAVERALDAGETFVEFTIGNPEPNDIDPDAVRWNGRPVYVRVDRIGAIGPPLEASDDDDDD